MPTSQWAIFERIADRRKAVGVRRILEDRIIGQSSLSAAYPASYRSFDALTRLPRLAFH
jgi:hypothetical protein